MEKEMEMLMHVVIDQQEKIEGLKRQLETVEWLYSEEQKKNGGK